MDKDAFSAARSVPNQHVIRADDFSRRTKWQRRSVIHPNTSDVGSGMLANGTERSDAVEPFKANVIELVTSCVDVKENPPRESPI